MKDDDVLDKADALLQRHRPAPVAPRAEPPVDFPILTEVVEEAPPLVLDLSGPSPPESESSTALTEAQLVELERELRLELLQLIGHEFERLIEAKVHERLGARIEEVIALTRTVLEAEVRATVREALAEAIAEETKRLKAEQDNEPPPL